MSARDDPVRVGHDPAVIQEDIDPGFGRQQRADVSFADEIRLARALDRLNKFRIRGVSKVSDLPANGLLPRGQGFDVHVDPRVRIVSGHRSLNPLAILRPLSFYADDAVVMNPNTPGSIRCRVALWMEGS